MSGFAVQPPRAPHRREYARPAASLPSFLFTTVSGIGVQRRSGLRRGVPWLLAVIMLLGGNACARSQGATLVHPDQPQEKIHSRLAKGLKSLPGWSLEQASLGDTQKVLILRKNKSRKDKALILVATAPSSKDGSEMAIQIRIDGQTQVPAKAHAAVMRELNAQHARNWAGTFFIDRSGALLGQWTLNLPDRALDLAFVRDAVLRLHASWIELQAALSKSKIRLDPAP